MIIIIIIIVVVVVVMHAFQRQENKYKKAFERGVSVSFTHVK